MIVPASWERHSFAIFIPVLGEEGVVLDSSVLTWIEKQQGESLAFLKRLIQAESYSLDKEGVNRASYVVEEYAASKGFSVARRHFEKAGDGLVLSLKGKNELPPICFVAHLDTVYPPGSFPLMLKEEDGYLYGPGAVDCKGGIAVALLAMEALHHFACPRPLRLLLAPDEEVSNRLSGEEGVQWIQENVQGCEAAIVCECGTQGEAVTERKGILKGEVEIRGKSVHAGMFYEQGASAIREAAYQILQLEESSNPNAVTYNCGIIEGGEAENRVPDYCRFRIDVRFRTQEEQIKALEHLQQTINHCRVPGTKAVWHQQSFRPPMSPSREGRALFERLQRAGQVYGLEKLSACANGGGSDAAYTAGAGIPTVCGMGATGFDWHSPRERVQIASLAQRAKLLTAAIADW